MKRVGLLVGSERSFPEALIAAINRRDAGVMAEMATVGAPRMEPDAPYDVIIDRISHEVPLYQSWLKLAALGGTYLINNPFWRIADDKYFGTALAHAIGVPVPRTVVLPNKSYIPGVVAETLRNLEYPLDWDAILQFTGLPAVLKVHWGGGWKDVHVVGSREELWRVYDGTGQQTMILQEFIGWEQYVRAIVIGRRDVLPVLWNPRVPHHERYHAPQPPLSDNLREWVTRDALRLCDALGYDMNTVEFGIRDGIPYAIDFMNSAPDFDISSLGDEIFAWVVEKMADLSIRAAVTPRPPRPYHWSTFLGAPHGT